MFRIKFLAAMVVAMVCAGVVSEAQAQPARTFVATTGSDANPCSVAAPCRTLGPAITAVASGGDVLVLDSGGFGENITITKSVSVIAQPGVVARVRAGTANLSGITINGSGISVTLSGIGITGVNVNNRGIYFLSGAALLLRNMDIAGPFLSIDQSSTGQLSLQNVTLSGRNCLTSVNGSTTVVDSVFSGCVIGVQSTGGIVSMARSAISGSSKTDTAVCTANVYGFSNPKVHLKDVTLTGCVSAIDNTGGVVTLANVVITGNGEAFTAQSVGRTYGDNSIFANTNNIVPGGITTVPGQ